MAYVCHIASSVSCLTVKDVWQLSLYIATRSAGRDGGSGGGEPCCVGEDVITEDRAFCSDPVAILCRCKTGAVDVPQQRSSVMRGSYRSNYNCMPACSNLTSGN